MKPWLISALLAPLVASLGSSMGAVLVRYLDKRLTGRWRVLLRRLS